MHVGRGIIYASVFADVALNLIFYQGDVALNLYQFDVRQPGKPTQKYGLRAYDEIILAPMVRARSHGNLTWSSPHLHTVIQCIFEPRVIEFDRKRIGLQPTSHPDVSDEIMEHAADHVVSHCKILLPAIFRPDFADASHDDIHATPHAESPTDSKCSRWGRQPHN